MERQISNWADASSEGEHTSEEEPLAYTHIETSAEPNPEVVALQNQLQNEEIPVSFQLFNLPYRVKEESEIFRHFKLPAEDCRQLKVSIQKRNDKPIGQAVVVAYSLDVAYKITEFTGLSFMGRPITIRLSGQRGYQKERGRRGNRGKTRATRRGRYGNFRDHSDFVSESGRIFIPVQKEPLKPVKPVNEITPRSNKPNPFGSAKPVDTQSKDIEFDKKMKIQEEEVVSGQKKVYVKVNFSPEEEEIKKTVEEEKVVQESLEIEEEETKEVVQQQRKEEDVVKEELKEEELKEEELKEEELKEEELKEEEVKEEEVKEEEIKEEVSEEVEERKPEQVMRSRAWSNTEETDFIMTRLPQQVAKPPEVVRSRPNRFRGYRSNRRF